MQPILQLHLSKNQISSSSQLFPISGTPELRAQAGFIQIETLIESSISPRMLPADLSESQDELADEGLPLTKSEKSVSRFSHV